MRNNAKYKTKYLKVSNSHESMQKFAKECNGTKYNIKVYKVKTKIYILNVLKKYVKVHKQY